MQRRRIMLAAAILAALTGRAAGATNTPPGVTMNKLAVLPIALALSSCSLWSSKVVPAVNAAINCAQAEVAVATKGQSVIEITVEVATAIADAVDAAATGDVAAAIEGVVEKAIIQFGEPVVACVLHDIDPGASAGSGSAMMASPPTIIGQIIAQHGWQFTK